MTHGYHKGMSKKWEERDRPRRLPVTTKTTITIDQKGKRRKRVERI
ncbi:hypothetical protein LCGC14_1779820 [marine sediment metagenome]|uniref:Uncharacterized protein n=1 Tax=marine sediment metagenome TaxID=412755 RepID=A0A0F9JAP5_9ZZZZ